MGSQWQVHILSFEGPDAYARAGGIATRVTGLAAALSQAGCDPHLWFVGDPALPGRERWAGSTLHRWCQWISRHHPAGVYDGEEGKRADYVASLPPFLMEHFLLPQLAHQDARAVILAEEWQTVHAILHLDGLLTRSGVRDRVALLWNANNTFGFDRIDWPRLVRAATITTVSRYMRQRMWGWGVDPLVIPNGLPAEAFRLPAPGAVREFRRRTTARVALTKIARWDPDKRWLLAIDTLRELKLAGLRPLLIARGGMEPHGGEVLRHATATGLHVAARAVPGPGARGVLGALEGIENVDLLLLTSPLDRSACRLLFRASSAVLANSGHEPFGLVGLEAMAAGGVVCVGATGEDYAVPGWNALVLQTDDPAEFVTQFRGLHESRGAEQVLRRNGRITASRFRWRLVVTRALLPLIPGFRAVRHEDVAVHPLARRSDAARSTSSPPSSSGGQGLRLGRAG
jgi:glycosyltransferase involved in cell wall biosynthesis